LAAHTGEVSVALRSQFPQYVEAVTGPMGRGIALTRVTPNTLTTLGLLLTVGAAWSVGSGNLVLGGWLLVAGGAMDTFDGAVARATERSTPFGGFYDSVTDRISDGIILAGVAFWLRDQPRLFLLAVVALVAAQVTSYVRAKAESIDLECSVGVLERAERAILLVFALVFHRWLLEPILWLLAVGGTVTVVQRIHHVWCQIDRDVPEELLALALHDRKWSRAFKAGARRFYGERNFDGALDRENGDRSAPLGAGHPVAPDPSHDGHSVATPSRDGHPVADASSIGQPVDVDPSGDGHRAAPDPSGDGARTAGDRGRPT
jgi:CDP-diacylglycerol---glycerol-3-phosphate 3-phosphatidyltransferase